MIKEVDAERKELKAKTHRWFFITWNNPPADWKSALADIKADFAYGQLEKGEQGTPHIQALLYYYSGQRYSLFKSKPFWIQGVSQSDAVTRLRKYCSKETGRIEGPTTIGDQPKSWKQGKDWTHAKTCCVEGRIEEIDPSIYIPYYSNLKKIQYDHQKSFSTDNVRGLWIFGEPGCGKSHYARELLGDSYYIKAQNKWFDGYNSQEGIILDDFDESGVCLGHYIKIWADKWDCSGEVKGGTTKLMHRVFAITSNYLPATLWQGKEVLVKAIERRFIFVIFYSNRKFLIGSEPGEIPVYNPFDVLD